ncbi:DedA family protein [Aliiroseovarius lamellibrachiae]|uniref:DedA family protein n=1 Tax=Aliiroseovarius lamellibrachiae TaxID=1924933 RepID=UPI001BE10434|nr:DedA family protein [Aliiroseovarius lamellibrachiae]MBT2131964.1 DedA family protein [Aliiroseovarius lamellibrachiae]
MNEYTLSLIPDYGIWVVFFATFLSCFALPIPSSLIMLAAGAFAASGELSLTGAAFAALIGAVLGDQIGFVIGKAAKAPATRFSQTTPKRAALFAKAADFLDKKGHWGIFLSRWLFSPLGPYINLLAGSLGVPWLWFLLWDILGELAWVTLYTGLGYAFSGYVQTIADMSSSVIGLLTALAIAIILARRLIGAYTHAHGPNHKQDRQKI